MICDDLLAHLKNDKVVVSRILGSLRGQFFAILNERRRWKLTCVRMRGFSFGQNKMPGQKNQTENAANQ